MTGPEAAFRSPGMQTGLVASHGCDGLRAVAALESQGQNGSGEKKVSWSRAGPGSATCFPPSVSGKVAVRLAKPVPKCTLVLRRGHAPIWTPAGQCRDRCFHAPETIVGMKRLLNRWNIKRNPSAGIVIGTWQGLGECTDSLLVIHFYFFFFLIVTSIFLDRTSAGSCILRPGWADSGLGEWPDLSGSRYAGWRGRQQGLTVGVLLWWRLHLAAHRADQNVAITTNLLWLCILKSWHWSSFSLNICCLCKQFSHRLSFPRKECASFPQAKC